MTRPLIGIVMGSDSDLPTMKEASDILDTFGLPYEMRICSAHRSPSSTAAYAEGAESRGLKILIAGAGGAAHLAGVLAAHTTLPVIGVPLNSSPLQGMDALLSTAQMPGGVPVATMAIGAAGARNAALLAVEILALSEPTLKARLKQYKDTLSRDVEGKDRALQVSRSSGVRRSLPHTGKAIKK